MNNEPDIENNKYSHIILDKSKRAFLTTVAFLTIIVFTSLLFENIVHDRHWATVAVPICLLGPLFILLPPIEKWVYEPWQSKHQQYERHFND